MKLARVFASVTKATPIDKHAFIGSPPLWLHEVETVYVSCTFSWDKPHAERLAREWAFRFPSAKVLIGGPAYGDPGSDFEPGLFLAQGYVITSRGCPNKCQRCFVPVREGALRLLPIRDGYNILDNNLLACPQYHIAAVLAMLRRQKEKPIFTGGLEAGRFTHDVAKEILSVKPKRMFFAYDRPDQLAQLRQAVSVVHDLTNWNPGNIRHHVSCYVLMGYPGDDPALAEGRIADVIKLNMRAYPMYYRAENYSHQPPVWRDLVSGVMAMKKG